MKNRQKKLVNGGEIWYFDKISWFHTSSRLGTIKYVALLNSYTINDVRVTCWSKKLLDFLSHFSHCNIWHSFVYFIVTVLAPVLFVIDEHFNCGNSLGKCVIPSLLRAPPLKWVTALQIEIMMQLISQNNLFEQRDHSFGFFNAFNFELSYRT